MTVSPQAGPRRYQLAELQGHVGQEIGLSDWLSVEQPRIDGFADATGDRQWIHIDPARAAQGPFGTTIAHGYLTLSLLPVLLDSALVIEDARMGVNYGLNKVRFTAPVPAGSRLRARFVLAEYRRLPGGGAQLTTDVTYELESGGKSPCVVQSIARFFT